MKDLFYFNTEGMAFSKSIATYPQNTPKAFVEPCSALVQRVVGLDFRSFQERYQSFWNGETAIKWDNVNVTKKKENQ